MCEGVSFEISHDMHSDYDVATAVLNSIPDIVDMPGLVHEIDEFQKAFLPPRKKKETPYTRQDFTKKYPQAFRDLLKWYFKAHDHNGNLMLERILGVLETGIDPTDIKKAVPSRHGQSGLEKYWKPYDISALQKIKSIVVEHMEGFLYKVFRINPIENKLKKLVKRGVINDPKDIRDITNDAYVISKMVDALDRGADLVEALKLAAKRPLSSAETEGIKWARENSAQHMRGLYRKVEDDVSALVTKKAMKGAEADNEMQRILYDIDQQMKRDIAREAVKAKIAGEDWRQFSTHLKNHWKNYSRDWDRIAFTEFSYIEKQGRALDYLKRHGPDVKVVKIPFPTACPICRLLYTDEKGNPRVFRLADMMSYGSNGDKWFDPDAKVYKNKLASKIKYNKRTGKFSADNGGMMPTIGPVHPWCRCVLMLFAEAANGDVPKYVKDNPSMMAMWDDITEILEKEMTVKKGVLRLFVRGELQ